MTAVTSAVQTYIPNSWLVNTSATYEGPQKKQKDAAPIAGDMTVHYAPNTATYIRVIDHTDNDKRPDQFLNCNANFCRTLSPEAALGPNSPATKMLFKEAANDWIDPQDLMSQRIKWAQEASKQIKEGIISPDILDFNGGRLHELNKIEYKYPNIGSATPTFSFLVGNTDILPYGEQLPSAYVLDNMIKTTYDPGDHVNRPTTYLIDIEKGKGSPIFYQSYSKSNHGWSTVTMQSNPDQYLSILRQMQKSLQEAFTGGTALDYVSSDGKIEAYESLRYITNGIKAIEDAKAAKQPNN